MLTALTSGLLLGLVAGLAPGPLMALTLSQSLRHGPREGCKVALAPLLTDPPVILLAVVLASRAADAQPLLGALSLAGGVFVLYLATETFRRPQLGPIPETEPPRSWLKGIAANLLSPHPWLFWMTVGASTLARALEEGWMAAIAFLASFYLLLVGCKITLALAAGGSRRWLSGRLYHVLLRILAALLLCFAVLLLHEGWQLLFFE